MRTAIPFFLTAVLSVIAFDVRAAEPTDVHLTEAGKAKLSIVIADEASPRMRAVADVLANYLSQISGASFDIMSGDGTEGIVLGLTRDFPQTPHGQRWEAPALDEREAYLLQTHSKGVWLLGASELAVEHAVWDFLYRLGHRQFFPGPRWEVVPHSPDLTIHVHVLTKPDYLNRRIWYGFGPWDYAQQPYQDWCAKNRTISGVQLNTGHAYGGIIRAKKSQFDRHPEYYALLDGQRKIHGEAKLCIGNKNLRRLVVEYALEQFAANPSLDSISMDPSDGGGWCECDACEAVGSASDLAILLANDVAEAVDAQFPDKRIGIYAYNYHSPPPRIRPHPRVVVSVATAFLKGGLTLDEILDGWSEHGTVLGIREYYSVNTWDRDLPGRARGGNLDYLKRTIPEFHGRGARYLSAESSDNWGPNGLGYYLAARMMWDVGEAEHADALVDDFLTRAFGPAKQPMVDFYQQLDAGRTHLVFEDQIGRMYRALDQAKHLADTAPIHGRLDDLTLYTRYVDLYRRYSLAAGEQRQAAFERLIRHAYRMRTTMMVHSKALYRDLAARDKSVSVPADCRWDVSEPRNPWKSSESFPDDELAETVREGIEDHALAELDFKPATFSDELVPAKPLELSATGRGQLGAGRGRQEFFTWVEHDGSSIELTITGGLIAHYRDRGNVRVEVWQVGGASVTGERETLVAEDRSVPPDGVERRVRLETVTAGLHKVVVTDGGDRTLVAWDEATPMTVVSSHQQPLGTQYGRWSLYFFVPRGTTVVGFFGGGGGEIVDSQGRVAMSLRELATGYHSVPVPPGEDGKLWQVRAALAPVRLMTVPPLLAPSAEQLLLPREVIENEVAE